MMENNAQINRHYCICNICTINIIWIFYDRRSNCFLCNDGNEHDNNMVKWIIINK